MIVPRGNKVGPAIFDRRRKRLLEGLELYYSPAITGPTGLDLLDLSGQNINGSLTGMDAPSDWVLSGHGHALDFDGTDDLVTASTGLVLTQYPFTLSSWSYLPTKLPSTNGAITCAIGTAFDRYFAIGMRGTVARPGIFARNTTFVGAGPSTGTYGDEWALLTGVFASATRRDLYYNGVLVGTSTTSVPELASASSVRVGGGFAALYYNSLVSEVIIHGRQLQPDEIAELYFLGNGGLGRAPKRTFLVTPVPSTGNRRRRIICGGMP